MTSNNSQVTVIGSTNIDLIMQVSELPKPGETVGDARFSTALGGKGANQAVAAARSGASVAFVSTVGSDDFGHQAREFFRSESIDVSHVSSVEGPTGSAMIFVDQHGENCIGVAPGANARSDLARLSAADLLLKRADVILLQLEIPLETVRAALSSSFKGHTILNAAPMVSLSIGDLKGLDTLVVNQTELAQVLTTCLEGDTSQFENTDRLQSLELGCRLLHKAGIEQVVVTLGSEGVFFSRPDRQATYPAFAVDIVDTTGAGDTFCGALAAGLARGASIEVAIRYAQAAAAITCTGLGAQSAIPKEQAVNTFLSTC